MFHNIQRISPGSIILNLSPIPTDNKLAKVPPNFPSIQIAVESHKLKQVTSFLSINLCLRKNTEIRSFGPNKSQNFLISSRFLPQKLVARESQDLHSLSRVLFFYLHEFSIMLVGKSSLRGYIHYDKHLSPVICHRNRLTSDSFH